VRRVPWVYPVELRAALAGFGLAPTPHSPPGFVRDALSDLYRYELRRLRDRLLAGKIARADYLGCVVTLRKHYWPLTLTPRAWEEICTSTGRGG
jgi:hypothetical protein